MRRIGALGLARARLRARRRRLAVRRARPRRSSTARRRRSRRSRAPARRSTRASGSRCGAPPTTGRGAARARWRSRSTTPTARSPAGAGSRRRSARRPRRWAAALGARAAGGERDAEHRHLQRSRGRRRWDPEGDRAVTTGSSTATPTTRAGRPVASGVRVARLLVRRRPARAPGHLPLPRARLRRARAPASGRRSRRRSWSTAPTRRRPRSRPTGAPDGGGWYRDTVTLTFAGAGDRRCSTAAPARAWTRRRCPRPRRSPPPARTPSPGSCATARATPPAAPRRRCRSTRRAPAASLTCPAPVRAGEPASATWSASDEGSGLAGAGHRLAAARHHARRHLHGALRGRRRRRPPHAGDLPVRRGGGSPTPDARARPPRPRPRRPRRPRPRRPTSPYARPDRLPLGRPAADPHRRGARAPGRPGDRRRRRERDRGPAPALRRTSRVAADGRVRLTLACAAACSGRLTLRAEAARSPPGASRRRAGRVTVVLRLARRDRRALARRHRLRVRVVIAPTGGRATARSVTLRTR